MITANVLLAIVFGLPLALLCTMAIAEAVHRFKKNVMKSSHSSSDNDHIDVDQLTLDEVLDLARRKQQTASTRQ